MKSQNTWSEEIVIVGNQLIKWVEQLVAKGNVRCLIIRKPSGKTLLRVPLTTGVAVGGVFAIMAPILTTLGALAALYAQVRLEVVHTGKPPGGR